LGAELYATNGTPAGTRLVEDINLTAGTTGTNGSSPSLLAEIQGRLVGTANDGVRGFELMFATGNSTEIVSLAAERGARSRFEHAAPLGTRVVFSATDGDRLHGSEPWITDGSNAATRILADLEPGADSSFPQDFVELAGKSLFSAFTRAFGRELWISDGTEAGTTLLRDIYPGFSASAQPHSSSPDHLTVIGDVVVFAATSPADGRELWVTDGTPAGTRQLANIHSGNDSSFPGSFTLFDGYAYFPAMGASTGFELWRTDGRSTNLVKDIVSGTNSSSPGSLFAGPDYLYFSAFTSTYGTELWRTDGTSSGTVFIKDLRAGSSSGSPRDFARLGAAIYFIALADNARELWKTDGTSAGTTMLQRLPSMSGLVALDGRLLFSGRTEEQGDELWSSDGTSAGTALLADLYPGCHGSMPEAISTIDGVTAWFVASDVAHGRELWRVDAAGVVSLARDFWPGPASGIEEARASTLGMLGGKLWVVADDGIKGEEPWRIDEVR
jgi:ELWxxDGT repeat protein